jgi:hypothetical protein
VPHALSGSFQVSDNKQNNPTVPFSIDQRTTWQFIQLAETWCSDEESMSDEAIWEMLSFTSSH